MEKDILDFPLPRPAIFVICDVLIRDIKIYNIDQCYKKINSTSENIEAKNYTKFFKYLYTKYICNQIL